MIENKFWHMFEGTDLKLFLDILQNTQKKEERKLLESLRIIA